MLDVLIIGSGPAGLSAAIYAKRANLNVLVAEKEYMGTGQIAESNQVDNYLGLIGKSGYELGEIFLEDVKKLGVEFYEGKAIKYKKCDRSWKVTFDNNKVLETQTVIYCAGATHRHLEISQEKKYEGKGISYCAVCDGAFYKDKNVLVVGGGDTAFDETLYLSEVCKKVYLVHRRQTFRGSIKTLEKICCKDNVEIITNAQVASICGRKKVEAVILNTGQVLEVAGIFVAIGMIPETSLLSDIVLLDENGYIVADETCKTSMAGFYGAGDVRTKHLRQVATAVADGANAAISACEYISTENSNGM